MPRGKKVCPKCNTETGPRSYTCTQCGYDFCVKKGESKRKNGRSGIKIDWRELKQGDYIRVLQGTGPYHEGESGRENLGYHGTFKVKFRDHEGIGAYPTKGSGFCYIYMGEERPSKIAGVLRPHKVRKIDPKYIR